MNTSNNKFTYTLAILCVLLLSVIFIQRCNRQETKVVTKTVTVEIPSKSGSFISPSVFTPLPNDQIVYKTDTIIQDSRMNRELVEAYIKTKDSLVRERLYKSAITKRKYKNVFDDNVQTITIDSEVEGNLLSLTPSYTIKPQTVNTQIQIKEKQPVLGVYVGGGISNNTSLDNFAAEAKLGIQNKRGDIFYGTYDTKGNIGIGYTVRLFQIKK